MLERLDLGMSCESVTQGEHSRREKGKVELAHFLAGP